MIMAAVAVLGCCLAAHGEETRLEDLSNLDLVENLDKTPLKDQSASWTPMQMGGEKFQHGLGTHAPFVAMIRLDGHTEKFRTVVGVNGLHKDRGSVEFIVTGDEKILFRSGVMKGDTMKDGKVAIPGDKPKVVDVSLSGVKRLKLEVTTTGDNTWGDDANWADAVFTWKDVAPRIVEIVDDACELIESVPLAGKSPDDTIYRADIATISTESVGIKDDLPRRKSVKNTAPSAPERLAVEGVREPIGVDNPAPTFSWTATHAERGQKQRGYQILVASSKNLIDADKGDVWSIQEKDLAQQYAIVYAGPALASKVRYWWKVRVWDLDGKVSPYSSAATFETAMMKPTDWKAQWIGGDFTRLRKEFELGSAKTIKHARAYVSGQGYYELRLNGKKVGDHVLDPGYTDYKFRALYSTYDITDKLKPGANAVGIMLGDAYLIRWELKKPSDKMAVVQIEVQYADDTKAIFVSDPTWTGNKSGAMVSNSVYVGEVYDARLEDAWDMPGYVGVGWTSVEVKTPPQIVNAQLQAIKVVDTVKPVKMSGKDGDYTFDFGQNMAGWLKVSASAPAGTVMKIDFGEGDHPYSSQKDQYTFKGEGVETWEPRFTYHGFRTARISGVSGLTRDSVVACVVHSAVDSSGDFTCSSPMLNKIHQAFLWTQVNNMHSIPTDCCQRDERKGWLGDALVTTEAACMNLDMKAFMAKWFTDIQDYQDFRNNNGTVANIAPCLTYELIQPNRRNWEAQDIPWNSAAVSLPWDLYIAYGDKVLLAKNYNMMRRYVDYVRSASPGNICGADRSRWGDWTGGPTDGGMLATGYYYRSADLLSRAARELGKVEDAGTYAKLAADIKAAFNKRWLKLDRYYNKNEQVANALALSFDLVPSERKAAVLARLKQSIEYKGGHLTTGVVGTHCLMNALWRNEAVETAYALANQTTQPSWGHMIAKGATTIWEFWDGHGSWNHPMLGGPIDAWFYKGVLGIYPTKPGYEELAIRPQIGGGLTFAKGFVLTPRGKVSSEWQVAGSDLSLTVTIPFNSQAAVSFPKSVGDYGTIYEGKNLIWKKGVLMAKTEGMVDARETVIISVLLLVLECTVLKPKSRRINDRPVPVN